MKQQEHKLPIGYYKEYLIPKKGGKFRKITAPSPSLLSYQRSQLHKLGEYFHKQTTRTELSNTVHGFIRGRNCVTGAREHIGYDATIMMDISNFFDSVTVNMIPEELRDPNFFHHMGYCAQGFATSPLLCNIALIPAMKQIHELLDDMFLDYSFTMYADDLQISINDDNHDEINDVIKYVTAIITNQGFSINAGKTRIKYAKFGYRRILGLNVGDTGVQATRRTTRKLRAARHQARTALVPVDRIFAGQSAGGLLTWSRCLLPKRKKK